MPILRDYREMKNPRLPMLALLGYVISLGDRVEFTSRDIAKNYKFSTAEAGARLNILRRYGLIKRVNRKRPYIYQVTPWGYKFYNNKQRKQEKDGI